MTTPWQPMPNPDGRNREFVRKVIATHVVNLAIPGMGNVYPGLPPTEYFDEGQPGSLYRANVGVHLSDIGESFQVLTGPDDLGGYFARYDAMLLLKHRCTDVNADSWAAAEDDHDRILDAIKTGLKGRGRDLGRPDVILQAAAWPAQDSIRTQTDEPFYNGGERDQWSRIFFTVSQYAQQQPPQQP